MINMFFLIWNFCTFLIRIHSMQGWTATTRHGITRDRNTKRSKHTGNLLRERCLLSLDIGQRKVFYMQKIPDPSFAAKETVDTDNLVTSSNGNKKNMQSIRKTSRPPLRTRKCNQLSQFRWPSTKVIPVEKT